MSAYIDKGFRFSTWVKSYRKDQVVALFHALNFGLAYFAESDCDPDGYPDLDKLDRVRIQALVKEGLVVTSDHDEIAELYKLREKYAGKRYLDMMYLLLHDGCNLKCSYCFEEVATTEEKHQPKAMSMAVVEQALELFTSLTMKYGKLNEPRLIHLYGGEPLLNPKGVRYAITRISEYVENGKLPSNTQITIVTNGTLVTAEIADIFAAHNVTVGLSLDGPEMFTNKHRLPRFGSMNVYSSVLKAHQLLKERGVRIGLSVTLTPEVVCEFDTVLRFLTDDLGIEDGLSFNILHRHPIFQTPNNYAEDAARCMVDAFKVFVERGIYEERMMRRAQSFVNRRVTYADCGVVGNQIVVAPDGAIGICQDFVKSGKYFSGTVFDENYDPYETNLFKDWIKRSPLFIEDCRSCAAIGICGGGCPANAELVTGSRWNIDTRVCPYSLQALEWLIWSTYDQVKS